MNTTPGQALPIPATNDASSTLEETWQARICINLNNMPPKILAHLRSPVPCHSGTAPLHCIFHRPPMGALHVPDGSESLDAGIWFCVW